MAIVGMEGFDYFDTGKEDIQLNYKEDYLLEEPDEFGIQVKANNPRFGTGKYLRVKNVDNQFRVNVATTSITDTMYIGFGFMPEKQIASTNFLYFYDTSGDVSHVRVKVNSNGNLVVKTGNGEKLAKSTQSLNLNTWYWIEVKVVIADSGTVDVKVDGVTWVTATGDTKVGSDPDIGAFALAGGRTDCSFDDVVWHTGTGIGDGFLDDCIIETLYPTGTPSFEWSIYGGAANNADAVNDIGDDATIDAQYVYTSTSGHEDYYYYDTISANSEVYALSITYRASRDNTGSRTVRSLHSNNGTQYGVDKTLTTGWLFYDDIYVDDGEASPAAWTQESIGTTHFGVGDTT